MLSARRRTIDRAHAHVCVCADVDGVRINSMSGVTALAEAVSASSTLRKLAAGYNSLGQNAGRALGEAAARSKHLTELDVSGNLVGLQGGRAICEAVHANLLLVRVDLRFNSLDARTRDELQAAVEARSDVRVQLA
jgi:Ran GTPase-activating protein (RanGAP) involved in mRNA processing and transport